MKPEEALKILDTAAALANLNREGHIRVQQAAELLRRTLEEKKIAEDKKK